MYYFIFSIPFVYWFMGINYLEILFPFYRCLHKTGGCINYKPLKCFKIAVVCCLLHNICIDHNTPLDSDESDDDDDDDDDEDVDYDGPLNDGKSVREQLIRQRFS